MQIGSNPFLYEVDYAFEEDTWYHIGITQVKQNYDVCIHSNVKTNATQHSFFIQVTAIKVYINGILVQTLQVSSPPPIHGNISLTFGRSSYGS